MQISELEQSIPTQLKEAQRRTARAIENATTWKEIEAHREKVNDLYMARFFWEKYHKRKRQRDFHTEESKRDALHTIIYYLGRIQ